MGVVELGILQWGSFRDSNSEREDDFSNEWVFSNLNCTAFLRNAAYPLLRLSVKESSMFDESDFERKVRSQKLS